MGRKKEAKQDRDGSRLEVRASESSVRVEGELFYDRDTDSGTLTLGGSDNPEPFRLESGALVIFDGDELGVLLSVELEGVVASLEDRNGLPDHLTDLLGPTFLTQMTAEIHQGAAAARPLEVMIGIDVPGDEHTAILELR